MRKHIIEFIIVLLTICNIPLNAQNWKALGEGVYGNAVRCIYADTTNNALIVGGNFSQAGGISAISIAKWNGISWSLMGAGNPFSSYPVVSITKYNGEIYAGCFSVGNGAIKKWDGSTWDNVGSGVYAVVWAMKVFDNELYISGGIDTVGGMPCKGIAKWNGSNWTCIGMPSNITTSVTVDAICEYNGELYFGGQFYSTEYPNDTIENIIRYDGNSWKSVGGGLHGNMDAVACIVNYKNELYVAGSFTKAHGNVGNYIQKWNGISWSEVGGGVMGINGGNGQISDLKVFHDELYAVGVFSFAGSVPAQHIAKWDGTNWCGLGSTFNNTIGTLAIYNDTLYIGGGFTIIDGDTINHIAKWTGGNYVDTCGNTASINEISNKENNITIYPNPAAENINVTFPLIKNGKYEILNILGGKIICGDIKNTNSIAINLNQIKSGLYLIKVYSENHYYSNKFIKE